MCQPASMVLTKDKVFWSMNTDSHEDIISEFKLSPDGARGPNVLRVEISPANGDMKIPLKDWVFKIDQDSRPSWFDAKEDEKRTRKALEDWAKARLFLGGEHTVKVGSFFAWDSATVTAGGSATVTAGGSATVTAWDSATVTAGGSATVKAWNSATVTAGGSATVKAWGSATVEAWGSATVILWSEKAHFTLKDLAVGIDRSVDGKVTTATAQDKKDSK